MSKVILHIGMMKTGSTSIQKSLEDYEDELFYYPKFKNTNHTRIFYTLFGKNQDKLQKLYKNKFLIGKKNKLFEKLKRQMKRELDMARGRNIIFSGEGISKIFSDEEILIIKKFFYSKGFKHFKVIGYIRSPYAFMSSIYQQSLKNIFIELNTENLSKLFPRYKKLFEKFIRNFEEVILRKFEPRRFPEGDVVLDFCSLIGLNLPKERIKKVNES